MIFEPGKFYMHEGGRRIAILGEVVSYKWGQMLVVEEIDKTGHGISCSESGQPVSEDRWTEIGRGEWLMSFGGEQ